MLLIIQNGKVVASTDDAYSQGVCDEAVIPAPSDFREEYMSQYSYADGVLTFPAEDVNRKTRNAKLSDCDWTQLPDVNLTAACLTAFQAYRQALRDVDLLNPVWPDAPAEEWAN